MQLLSVVPKEKLLSAVPIPFRRSWTPERVSCFSRGTVTGESEWGIKEGFTVGTIHIAGEGAFAHQTSKIWYKNENMVMWIDDKVNLTCPDLICVVEKATGYPITNPNCVEGMEVAVLGFHCHELWTRERALEILNPRFFGFDMDCVFLQD